MLWSFNNFCVMYADKFKTQSFNLPRDLNLISHKT